MRFVSTALVMMTIALMLLALMLLGPAAYAKSDDLCSEPCCANKSPPDNSQTTRIENALNGTVVSYLGDPDAGLATYTDILDPAAAIAQAISKPLIADAGTGYHSSACRFRPMSQRP